MAKKSINLNHNHDDSCMQGKVQGEEKDPLANAKLPGLFQPFFILQQQTQPPKTRARVWPSLKWWLLQWLWSVSWPSRMCFHSHSLDASSTCTRALVVYSSCGNVYRWRSSARMHFLSLLDPWCSKQKSALSSIHVSLPSFLFDSLRRKPVSYCFPRFQGFASLKLNKAILIFLVWLNSSFCWLVATPISKCLFTWREMDKHRKLCNFGC